MRRKYYTDDQGFVVTVRASRPDYWLKLPRDVIIMILQKVGILDIMISSQLVCSEWRDICTDPSTWTAIRVADWKSYWTYQLLNLTEDEYTTHVENLIRQAVDRSCGTLLDLDLDELMSEELLYYVVERCTQLRRLRGVPREPRCFIEDIVEIVASRLPLLEELELVGIYSTLLAEEIETLGSYCPKLSSLKICVSTDEIAKIIARSMPQLRHICFSGKSFVTDVGVEALFDGCTHLESLDIRECYRDCFFFNITGAFLMMKNLPLTRTQWRQWLDILDDPCTWRIIRVADYWMFTGEEDKEHVIDIILRAVDESCGGLVDVDLDSFMSEDMLGYIVERCTQIRRLHGYMRFSEEALRAAVARLPLLEDLELDCCSTFSAETIETLGRCCPRLTSLKIPFRNNEDAKTLARSLPQLRHFKPIGAWTLTDEGVEALLDGCPHLESLDHIECDYVKLNGSVGIRCSKQIKHLQRPCHRYYCSSWSCCDSIEYQSQRNEDDYDYNQFYEEDVNYTIDRREEHWSRRENARCRETLIWHLRRQKGNKNSSNNDMKRDQKDRRRREFMTSSRREVKKEFVHWNKIATNPCTLYNILI